MKLLFFDDYKLGVVKGDRVVDVSSVVRDIPHTGPGDLINNLIARFDQYRGKLEDAAASGQGVALSRALPAAGLIGLLEKECIQALRATAGLVKE